MQNCTWTALCFYLIFCLTRKLWYFDPLMRVAIFTLTLENHSSCFLKNGHVSNSCSFICCYYYCLAECFVLTIMSPSDDISGYKGCKKILLAKSRRKNHPTKLFHNSFFNLKNLKHKISQYSKTSENIDQCETHCSGGRFDPWIGTTKKMIYF